MDGVPCLYVRLICMEDVYSGFMLRFGFDLEILRN